MQLFLAHTKSQYKYAAVYFRGTIKNETNTIKMSITIVDYNPEWKEWFENLKEVFVSVLEDYILDIQHVGSTSIEGLAAKPIIDIDIISENCDMIPLIVEKLRHLGYVHLGEMGIIDRHAFRRTSDQTPQNGSDETWHKHNLYVCPQHSISLQNHLTFRDYLRSNPDKIIEYGDLKRKIVAENPNDINRYCELKTPFITEILRLAGFDGDVLNNIAIANKVTIDK